MARKETQKKAGTGAKRGPAAKGRGVKSKAARGGVKAGQRANIAATGGPSPAPTAATFSHEQIAERAREIWEQRGHPQGEDEKIWLEAEVQLTHELVVR
jgi:hypothetical protein